MSKIQNIDSLKLANTIPSEDDKNNMIARLVNKTAYLQQEIERLHSIIKEVKDFINGKDLKENEYRFAEDFDFTKLLEILERENKE